MPTLHRECDEFIARNAGFWRTPEIDFRFESEPRKVMVDFKFEVSLESLLKSG